MLEQALQSALTRENMLLTTILEKNQLVQAMVNKINTLAEEIDELKDQLEATQGALDSDLNLEGDQCEETPKNTKNMQKN